KFISGKSNQLKYAFASEDSEAFFTPKDLSIIGTNEYTLGLYVFGDFSNNELQAEFSVDGDVKYAKIATLNFAGWKYQEIDLKNVLPEGISYQFTGLKVVKRQGLLSNSGDLFVDNMMLYKTPTGLNKTELKNIAVYPNPAKDVINVDWNKNETPTITVYALSGVKITSTKATNINVSNLSEGIYMLKVEGKDKTFTTPVAVVK
ncbi:MAG TPA: T9SS type A sorting domain-containing protein, partial [Paludibacteraceae bacterium]|nr:T9SS type A sorting domain-containing protein [Paludibacteraceae bacterium]